MAFSKLKSRLLTLFVFWGLLVCLLGAVTVLRLRSLTDALESVYQDRLVCQVQLRKVGDAWRVGIPGAVARWRAGEIDAAAALAQLDAAQQQASDNWQRYKQTTLVAAEQRLIERTAPLLARAEADALTARRLIQAGDRAGLEAWAQQGAAAGMGALGGLVDELFALQEVVAGADVQQARTAQQRTLLSMVVLGLAGFLAGGGLAWALVLHYTRVGQESTKALRRMNAFYTALSRTNHLIVRASDDVTLLHELCRICTETGHARITAIFRVEGEQVMRFAASGEEAGFFAGLPEVWDVNDADYRQSVTAIALSTGTPGVGRVPQQAGTVPSWRDTARAHGIRSIAAFPLRRGGRIYGSLTLYAGESDFFDPELTRLLQEMADDVSFALDNLDREAARVQLQVQTRLDLERFEKLFRATPVACAISTLEDAQVLEVNDVMCRLIGKTREQLIGRRMGRLGALLIEEDAEVYRDQLDREGRVRNMEGRVRLAGGGLGTFIVNAETIAYGGQTCVMAMALDVTELRAAAAAQQARAAAEAANREKTAFLSRMSHELRTPLNAMLGFTQLMQRDARPRLLAQDVEQLEQIRQAGWHLLSLVNDVMDVSRIEAGQFEVRAQALPLAGLLDEVLQLSEVAARDGGIAIQAAYREQPPLAVTADPLRLRQVLLNLVSNAIKYNRPGGAVRVGVQAAAAGVVIELADTGAGMSAEQLQHLYEPFNRLGRERGSIQGTGLGLALTRQLVGLMGGELAIESQPGVGTTARVTLPAAALPAPTAKPAAAVVSGATAEPRGTVLYIEDNEINVMVIEEMLRRWSEVQFVHAPDGASGIEQAARLQPDVVLMDMQLPDMDGLEILQRLRANAATAGLRVIALSASAMPEEVERTLAGGAADYWTKPVDLDRFLLDMARNLAGSAR
jgi:PAS domain S-box-containing protein